MLTLGLVLWLVVICGPMGLAMPRIGTAGVCAVLTGVWMASVGDASVLQAMLAVSILALGIASTLIVLVEAAVYDGPPERRGVVQMVAHMGLYLAFACGGPIALTVLLSAPDAPPTAIELHPRPARPACGGDCVEGLPSPDCPPLTDLVIEDRIPTCICR